MSELYESTAALLTEDRKVTSEVFGEGTKSVIVLHSDIRPEYASRNFIVEFRANSRSKAIEDTVDWMTERFPQYRSFVRGVTLWDNPQFGVSTPFWTLTFMGMNGESPETGESFMGMSGESPETGE